MMGKLIINGGKFLGKKIVFHDPCYLGCGNDVYEAPRDVIKKLDAELFEMKRSRANGFCLWCRWLDKCLKNLKMELKM